MKRLGALRAVLLSLLAAMLAVRACGQSITVNVADPLHPVSPLLFGAFFEEINQAGDGGLYAEMIRNRSFNNSSNPDYWTLVTTAAATGTMSVSGSNSLNVTNTSSLMLTMKSGPGTVGAESNGFWGIPLQSGSTYNFSFYARGATGFSGAITAQLRNSAGNNIYAQQTFTGVSGTWQKFTTTFTPTLTDTNADLVVSIAQSGTIWLDVVSLFPQATFNNHSNGLRPDLANYVEAMHPAFLRFPGGNFIEGTSISTAERWKTTIGDISVRPGHWNSAWNYLSTDGLGYQEYLQFCEDLDMLPVFDINSGQSLDSNGSSTTTVPLASMGPWVQDAPDAVQYATGDSSTTWGAQRTANGHPDAFEMPYMEIGNESSGTYYNQRYSLFYAALTGSYPGIRMISPDWGGVEESVEPLDIVDQHYYESAATFESYSTMYDSYPRSGPYIFVGEYAVTSGYGTYGNLSAALGEAAFMTGLERNSDVVIMASYAPLFCNVNAINWQPDLIYYNNNQSFATPSYYVQKLFGNNTGTIEVPAAISYPPSSYEGGIGLSTWSTQAEFNNIQVTGSSGQTLYQSNFATSGTPGWSVVSGSWAVSSTDGALQQTADDEPDTILLGANNGWTDYTLSLQVRKLGGSEGFQIMFYVGSTSSWVWWNVGGWTNTLDGIEPEVNGTRTVLTQALAPGVSFTPIQTGTTYNIQIKVNGPNVSCYLNGVLTQSATLPPTNLFQGGVGYATWSTQSEYNNVSVTGTNGQTLYQSNFASTGTTGLTIVSGNWAVSSTDGALQQTANDDPDIAYTGAGNSWSNYTLNLQARKISGNEGFLVMFYVNDANDYAWWDVGGWTNTADGIQQDIAGTKTTLTEQLAPGASFTPIATGTWYNIQIQVTGNYVQCYLNRVLTQTATLTAYNPVFASASLSPSTNEVIIKAVNPNSLAWPATINLAGLPSISATAPLTVLTAVSGTSENSFAAPVIVSPVTETLSTPSTQFAMNLPAYSVSVLRVQVPIAQPQNVAVTPASGSAVVSWSAATGASTYTVERAASPGGPWTVIATGVTGLNYTDTAVQTGQVYYYTVTAANALSTSAASAVLDAMPVVPPVSITNQGVNALVSLQSTSGVSYQLQESPSLTGSAWTNIGPLVTATGGLLQVTATNALLNGPEFFRFNLGLPTP